MVETIIEQESQSKKLNKILPSLLESNNKSGSYLLDKLKVNSFFQNHENKAKKNLIDLIKLSDNRHKLSRNGDSLNGIIAKSSDDFRKISNNIIDDNFFKKNDSLQEEIKILKDMRKTEEEKKIPDLISLIRNNLKRKKIININKEETKEFVPSSRNNIVEIKNFLTEKLNEEQLSVNKNFAIYKDKLKLIEKFPELGKKNFGDFQFSLNLNSLYYKKPIKQNKVYNRRDYTNLNKINRIMLNKEDDYEKQKKISSKKSETNFLDGLKDYKNIVKVVKSESINDLMYSQRMNSKKEKFKTLINKGLPGPSEYDKILYKEKIKKQSRNKTHDEEQNYGTENYLKEFQTLKQQSHILMSDEFFINKFYENQDKNNNKFLIKTKNKKINVRSLSEENLVKPKKPKYLIPLPKYPKREYIFKPKQNLNNSNITQSTNIDQISNRQISSKLENEIKNNNIKNYLKNNNTSKLLFENNEL